MGWAIRAELNGQFNAVSQLSKQLAGLFSLPA
jgi:hypothetical protein